MRLLVSCLLLSGAVAPAVAQEAESLWMPEGFKLLSIEERQALPPEEWKALGARNMQLLDAAVTAMSPAERAATSRELERFAASHPLKQYEKQYVTIVEMKFLAAATEEKIAPVREQDRVRFEKLLAAQESSTKGFPSDLESVEREAGSLERRYGKIDASELYLLVLRPLRARPWNDSIRVVFRGLVRSDSSRSWNTSLYDAALVFLRAREKESPEEGAWFSLEGILRLSLRGEVDEARRLFGIATAKQSKDVESRLFPLLLAEMDGDAAQVQRLLPRAREGWPKADDFDRAMLSSIDVLPSELAARARKTFGKKYQTAHPSDWPARIREMEDSLIEARNQELRRETPARAASLHRVESEASLLLALPASALPEPFRTQVTALRLRSQSDLGRCEEVESEIAAFERSAAVAYPPSFDPDAPPAPRAVTDVRRLRSDLANAKGQLERIRKALADGSIARWPELASVPAGERTALAKETLASVESEISNMNAITAEPDDAKAADDWTRRELASWEAARGIRSTDSYDSAGRAGSLSVQVRSSQGRCYLAKARPTEAARVLEPCAGSGRNLHNDCVLPLVDAAIELVRAGDVDRGVAIYRRIANGQAGRLYEAIERASPGVLPKPTPRPTPNNPVPEAGN